MSNVNARNVHLVGVQSSEYSAKNRVLLSSTSYPAVIRCCISMGCRASKISHAATAQWGPKSMVKPHARPFRRNCHEKKDNYYSERCFGFQTTCWNNFRRGFSRKKERGKEKKRNRSCRSRQDRRTRSRFFVCGTTLASQPDIRFASYTGPA